VNAVFDQLSTAENGHWGSKNREKCIIFLKKLIKMQKNHKNNKFYQKNQENHKKNVIFTKNQQKS
jgi:hypothetical protein